MVLLIRYGRLAVDKPSAPLICGGGSDEVARRWRAGTAWTGGQHVLSRGGGAQPSAGDGAQ